MIFIIRIVTALCFFALLGKANIWLDVISNTFLAIGYRSFLVLAPLLSRLTKQYSIAVTLLISSIGMIVLGCNNKNLNITGTILVSIGLSVSSYMIRFKASETPSGAAHNKIAANIGSVLSGIVLLFTFTSKIVFFGSSSLLLMVLSILAFITIHKQNPIILSTKASFNLRRTIGWALLGVAVGIKLFGVFSVLPQFLLVHTQNKTLPAWYGIMIFVNSICVILFQLPIIHWLEKFKPNNNSIKLTCAIMSFGMILIACPQIFHVDFWFGALLWTIMLSLVECAASYLDVEGSRARFLLVKETFVGVGGGLTVIISRVLPPSFSSITIGAIGIISIFMAIMLLNKDFQSLNF